MVLIRHLNLTKNEVLFLFTFQVKAVKLRNYSNHAAFGRFHRGAVNISGLMKGLQSIVKELPVSYHRRNRLPRGGTISGILFQK